MITKVYKSYFITFKANIWVIKKLPQNLVSNFWIHSETTKLTQISSKFKFTNHVGKFILKFLPRNAS